MDHMLLHFFANLSPYHYENKWITNMKKLILEGLDAFEVFLDSLMTWLHSKIVVSLTEAFGKFILLNFN